MLVNHSQTTSDYIPQTAVGSETQHFNFDFSLYFLLFLDNIKVNSLDKVLIFIFLIQIKKKKKLSWTHLAITNLIGQNANVLNGSSFGEPIKRRVGIKRLYKLQVNY